MTTRRTFLKLLGAAPLVGLAKLAAEPAPNVYHEPYAWKPMPLPERLDAWHLQHPATAFADSLDGPWFLRAPTTQVYHDGKTAWRFSQHRWVERDGLPQPRWRVLNAGVDPSRTTYRRVTRYWDWRDRCEVFPTLLQLAGSVQLEENQRRIFATLNAENEILRDMPLADLQRHGA